VAEMMILAGEAIGQYGEQFALDDQAGAFHSERPRFIQRGLCVSGSFNPPTPTPTGPPVPATVPGVREGLALPYRGQEIPTLPSAQDMQSVPEGPCRLGPRVNNI
jgi:hypothetical protein